MSTDADAGDGDYEVVFSGETYSGADVDIVKAALGRLFGQSTATIEHMFAAGEVVIKTGISREHAQRYQAEMAKAGAIARVQRHPDAPSTEPAASALPGPAQFNPGASQEFSLSGISVALMMCPRCGHEQLEGDFCARCNVDVKAYRLQERRRRKEDLIIERRIRDLREKPEVVPRQETVVTAAELAERGATVFARFGLRLAAGTIDIGLAGVLCGLGYVTLGIGGLAVPVADLPVVAGVPLGVLLWPIGVLLAGGLLGWLVAAGSPGYLLLGMRIRAADGESPAGARLLLRALCWPLCVVSVVGMLMPLFERRGRALHDVLAGTVVVVQRSR